MGPFELMDLIGLDVNLAVTKSVWEAYFHDPRYAPSVLQQELRRRGLPRPQDGARLLRLREGRGEARAAHRGRRSPRPQRVDGARRSRRRGAARASGSRARGVTVERARADSRVSRAARSTCRAARAARGSRSPTAARRRTRVARLGVRDLVVFDLALDYAHGDAPGGRARRHVQRCGACAAAVGALQAAGIAVSRLDDVAGLAVLRTVAMLANEAADAVHAGRRVPRGDRPRDAEGRQLSARAARVGRCDRRRDCVRDVLRQSRRALRRGPLPHLAADRAPARGDRSDGSVGEHHPATAARQDAQALAERVARGDVSRATARRRRSACGSRRSRPGAAELSMTVRADMLNGHEICHGGFIFTLADSAFAFACNSYNLDTVASGCAIEFPRAGARRRRADGARARAQRSPAAPASTTSRSTTSAARRSRCSAARATGSRACDRVDAGDASRRRSGGCAMPVKAPRPGELEPIETASRDELAALQLERMQLVARARLRQRRRTTAQVRRRRRASAATCKSLADLAKFPFTTKADLRDNYPFGMFAVPREQVVRIHASSGTTGKPTVVGYTAQGHRHVGDRDGALDPRGGRARRRHRPRRVRLRALHRRPRRALRRREARRAR